MSRFLRILVPAAACATLFAQSNLDHGPRSARARPVLAGESSARHALWVYFDSAAAQSSAPPALSEQVLRDRARRGVPLFPGDRPVPAHLIQSVIAQGARVRQVSRWLRAVSVDADPATAERLARLPAVALIRPVARLRMADAAGPVPVSVRPTSSVRSHQAIDSTFYGPIWRAVSALGIPTAHRLGFTGEGVRIAILDTGFEPEHESLAGRRVTHARDFINGDTIVYNQSGDDLAGDPERHGTRVWSLLGGRAPGTLVGPAHDAEFLLAKVDREPNDSTADEDRWVAAVEWAESVGARIIISAVVFRFDFVNRPPIPYAALDGQSTASTRAAAEAARRGVLVVTAMGDDGPSTATLSAPADGDSLIAVGATDLNLQVASFSSRGPTADGRLKPELVAPGVDVFAASSAGPGVYDVQLSGTSYSAPLIAGGAALVMEAWPTLDAMAVRNALLLSATRARSQDNVLGHGVPDIASAILFPQGVTPVDVATRNLDDVFTTVAPRFFWTIPLLHAAAASVRYTVEVGTDSLFQRVILRDTIRDQLSYTSSSPLKPATGIWWRVRAEGAFAVRRISPPMGPFTMPGWVQLLSPNPDQFTPVDSLRPHLTWVPLAVPSELGPFVYDVEVLSNQTGRLVQPTMRDITTSSVEVREPLTPNQAYRWRVIARLRSGAADTVESASPFFITRSDSPPITLLQQNFPNPFPRPDLGLSETRIWFDLEVETRVELAVFDLRGRLIKQLIPVSPDCGPVTLPPGIYGRVGTVIPPITCGATSWDGTDHAGRTVARGVYMLRLRAAGKDYIRHMVFLPR